MRTLFSEDIKDRFWLSTLDTPLSIKERFIQGTVGNIMIPDVSLIVLFDQVIDILIPQYPSISVNISLVYGWRQNRLLLALGLYYLLQTIQQNDLFLSVFLQSGNFIALGSCRDLLL